MWQTAYPWNIRVTWPVGQSMDKSLLEGTWQEFEALIRDTIGSDFRWRVRPQDTRSNRGYYSQLNVHNPRQAL